MCPLHLNEARKQNKTKQNKKKKTELTIRKSSFYTPLRQLMVSAVPRGSVVSDFLRPHRL